MFAYCGNNPVARADLEGNSWIAVLGAVGLQYVSDILGNIADDKTGADIFIPTSSLATYTASAITALIPGGSIGSAFVRSVATEAILWVDNILNGKSELNDIKKSGWSILGNTVLDLGMGVLMDNTFGQFGTDDLSTYSSNPKQRQSGSNLNQIYNSMQRSNTIGRAIGKFGATAYEFAVDYFCS